MNRISYDDLCAFTRAVLDALGLDAFSAEAVTTGLCETSLRGVDSHGIRLLPHYVRATDAGRRNPRPDFKITQRFPTIARLDADNGFGHAAGMRAIDHAMETADAYGTGVVGVINSSHPGAMASYALRAARRGYVGFAFTHADSLLLSHGGTRPFFGTNPVCVAAPREEQHPFCLDMATSVYPWNKVMHHGARGEKLPAGIAADAEGRETRDPEAARSLLPAGGYKGYGLAAMVEMLCAIFTGTAFGPALLPMYDSPLEEPRRLGQFYMVLRCDGCVPAQAFRARLQEMTEAVRREPALPGESVMLANDPQIQAEERRLRDGIPLDKVTLEELKALSERFGVALRMQ